MPWNACNGVAETPGRSSSRLGKRSHHRTHSEGDASQLFGLGVDSHPAEEHGAETRPVLGLQTADSAGAEQAPQLDAGYDPVWWSPSGWIGGVHYDPIERRSEPPMPKATR